MPSDRMLVRQLWKDQRLKRLCDIENSLDLFRRAACQVKPGRLVADPQYSAQNLRDAALERESTEKRAAVERVFSRLKNLAGLKEHNLRGLAKIAFHS